MYYSALQKQREKQFTSGTENKMRQGNKFKFQGREYLIDLIGPKQTLLLRDDDAWQLIETETLRHFLENAK